MSNARHNQSLQQTLDPVATLAIAKSAPASIAAEPRRYAAGLSAIFILALAASVSSANAVASVPTAPQHNPEDPIVAITPMYPSDAGSSTVNGRVVVQFTLDKDGSPVNPRIVESFPRGYFDEVVLQAFRKYRWLPDLDTEKVRQFTFTFAGEPDA